MSQRKYFLQGKHALRIIEDCGVGKEGLKEILIRKLEENQQIVRTTAKVLKISHQTLHNWCQAMGIKTLTPKKASKVAKRRSLSEKQANFIRDFGRDGWSLDDTLVMLLGEAADGDLSTASTITGLHIQILMSWCDKYEILYFTSVGLFYNHSHNFLVQRIEKEFAHLGDDWGKIIIEAMRLHNNDVYKTAIFLKIQNITAVRWCAYWGIPFVSKPKTRAEASHHFKKLSKLYSRDNSLSAQ